MKNYLNLLKHYDIKTLVIAGFMEIHRIIWKEGIKNSYAQNYEDLLIEKIIDKKKGKYLEVGGYHPTRLSNTYRFYKKGWTGTIVEPNPEVKSLFEKQRPKDKFVGAGVAENGGQMEYYQFYIPALNTFSKKEYENSIKNGHSLYKITKVPTITIDKVVENEIDLLSLDTEGFDETIIKNWPWDKCKPTVICVEKDMSVDGYKLAYKTKHNSILVVSK